MKKLVKAFHWRVYRFHAAVLRFGVGWLYAIGRLDRANRDRLRDLIYDAEQASEWYALEGFSAASVIEDMAAEYVMTPKIERLARQAARRVASKWDSDGNLRYAAISWAIDLVKEYAQQDGIELEELS